MRLVLTPVVGRKSDVERRRMRSQEGLHVLFELLEIFVTFTIYLVVTLKGFFMVLCGRSLCRLLGPRFWCHIWRQRGPHATSVCAA